MTFKLWDKKWPTVPFDGTYFEMYQCLECEQLFEGEVEHICHPLDVSNVVMKKNKQFAKSLEKKFPQATVVETIRKIYQEKIILAERKIEESFLQYDELARKGVPFSERSAAVDISRVEWLKKYIIKLKDDSRRFRVVPFSSWVTVDDYEKMKRVGFYDFMKFWFGINHVIQNG